MSLRGLFLLCLAASVALAFAATASAEAPAPAAPTAAPFQKDKVDRAVDRAVKFILSKQDPQAGFLCDTSANRTAITSLAVLAMAAAGHQPADASTEGRAMKKAVRYVLQPGLQEEDGYFGRKDGSRMYGHGITTLMAAEMLGQGTDEAMDDGLRRACQAAVGLILRSQQTGKEAAAQGGWRYTPDSNQSDLSVTVWQLLALRSARNAGIPVPARAIDEALAYIKRCYLSELDAGGKPLALNAGFGYTPGSSKYMSTSTSAMGLLSLQLCGEYDSPFARGAAAWLLEHPPSWGHRWLFYGSYYYAQAMYQCGGPHAARANQVIKELLLPEQRPDGSWEASSDAEREAGAVYTTSLATLALAGKFHYLPVHQR